MCGILFCHCPNDAVSKGLVIRMIPPEGVIDVTGIVIAFAQLPWIIAVPTFLSHLPSRDAREVVC